MKLRDSEVKVKHFTLFSIPNIKIYIEIEKFFQKILTDPEEFNEPQKKAAEYQK